MHILWVILIGLVAGALARLIVPGTEPGGARQEKDEKDSAGASDGHRRRDGPGVAGER